VALAALQARRREAQAQLQVFITRESGVSGVQSRLNSEFDNDITTLRTFNERTANALVNGLRGNGLNIPSLADHIMSLRENHIWNDGKMSEVSSNCVSEITRCRAEIERLRAEIRALDAQIVEEIAAMARVRAAGGA